MNGLPKGWINTQIGQVITLNEKLKGIDDEIECGFVPMALMPTAYRGFVNFETKTWGSCKKGFTQFKDGDVLLAKITPCFENGKGGIVTGLPNGIGAGSTEYFVLRCIDELIQPQYLHAFVKSKKFMDDCEVHMGGSVGHKRVPKDYLLKYEIPLAPLNEQIRIANKLDFILAKVDKAQARLDKIPAILKRFRQSVLAAATSGELTKEWRGTREIDTWSFPKIKEVGRVQLGRQRSPKYHSGENMKPYLRVQNVFENLIDTSDVMEMDFSEEDFQKYRLYDGDILLNEGQSPKYLGRPAVYRGELEEACFTNTLIRFQANDLTIPEYAILVFRHHMHSGRYIQEGTITTNIAHLGAGRFSNVEYPLAPLSEQKEIVRLAERLLSKADRVEKQYLDAKARLDRLTQSILAKAFRGELVPQDPNDEPAEKLLERILAEKELSKPKKTTRKRATKAKTAEKE